MADTFLTQHEGDTLFGMKKIVKNQKLLRMPASGGALDIRLQSKNRKEDFVLNYTQHAINLSKRNHHLRARSIIGLVRLDLDGPPHKNPDGQEIGPRHVHLYRENFGLKWAYDIPNDKFSNLENDIQTLKDFMAYCNVISMPELQKTLLI